MTNPPFYSSQTELDNLAKQKSRPPNSACTGAPVEMVCPGGEVAFVTQLIEESKTPQLRHKITWSSSMLGKLNSVPMILETLRYAGCTNYAVTEFVQGQKTRRWCVAWSWKGLRPPQDISRGTDAVDKKFLPFPTEFNILLTDRDYNTVVHKLDTALSKLSDLEWNWSNSSQSGLIVSWDGDVWSRSARRKKQKAKMSGDQMDVDKPGALNTDDAINQEHDLSKRPKLAVRISLPPALSSEQNSAHLRWLEGEDRILFESFHGWLKRNLQ